MLKRVRRQYHGLSFGSSLTKPRLITARSPAARRTTAGAVGFGDWHRQVAGVGDRRSEAARQDSLPIWLRDEEATVPAACPMGQSDTGIHGHRRSTQSWY